MLVRRVFIVLLLSEFQQIPTLTKSFPEALKDQVSGTNEAKNTVFLPCFSFLNGLTGFLKLNTNSVNGRSNFIGEESRLTIEH